MRTISGTELSLIGSPKYEVHLRVEMEESSGGSFQNLSNRSGVDWIEGVSWDWDLDRPVPEMLIDVRRDHGTDSLQPLDNNDIDAGREFRVYTAATTPGGSPPSSANFDLMFEGVVDDIDWKSSPIKVTGRSKIMSVLADQWLESSSGIYGSTGGTAIETVIQDILNDHTTPTPTLQYSSSPGFLITPPYQPDKQPVLRAVQTLAQMIGWDVREIYSSSAGAFQLTLYEPDRNPSSVMHTFGPDDYFAVNQMAISREDVRNVVSVIYGPTSSRKQEIVQSTASIDRYGRRWMEIEEASNSAIALSSEANTLAQAALDDLEEPSATHEIELPYWWPAELQDYYGFSANNIHYDSTQEFGVYGISHELKGSRHRTKIRARGKPAGQYVGWYGYTGGGGGGTEDGLTATFIYERPVSAGIVSGKQNWKREFSVAVGPLTNSLQITVKGGIYANALDNRPPASLTVSDYTYTVNVTPGEDYVDFIKDTDGTTDKLFETGWDEGNELPGLAGGGFSIEVVPFSGAGGTLIFGETVTVIGKDIRDYDDIGFRANVFVDKRVHHNGPTPSLPPPLGGDELLLNNSANGFAVSFTPSTDYAVGQSISSITMPVRREGNPTGVAVAKIYADSTGEPGTLIDTSADLDVSTLSTSTDYGEADWPYSLTEFEFPSALATFSSQKKHYSVEYSGGDASNYIAIAANTDTDDVLELNGSWSTPSTQARISLRVYESTQQERFGRAADEGSNINYSYNEQTGTIAIEGTASTGGGASALDDLTDVTVTSPGTGQLIQYSSDGQWENTTTLLGEYTFKADILGNPGSGASPGYSFDGDTDTGMFRATADAIGLATAATERMRVTAAGRVLIDRTTETLGGGNGYNLQIGSGASGAGLTIHTGTASLGDIQFADGTAGDASYRGLIRYDHGSDELEFWASAASKMVISSVVQTSVPIYALHDVNTVFFRFGALTGGTANERRWDIRTDSNGQFELRSINDAATTVAQPLQFNHDGQINYLNGPEWRLIPLNSTKRLVFDASTSACETDLFDATFNRTWGIGRNLRYTGSNSPETAANYTYIDGPEANSQAGALFLMYANNGGTFKWFTAPTSTGAGLTPASLDERMSLTSTLHEVFVQTQIINSGTTHNIFNLRDNSAASDTDLQIYMGFMSSGAAVRGAVGFYENTTTDFWIDNRIASSKISFRIADTEYGHLNSTEGFVDNVKHFGKTLISKLDFTALANYQQPAGYRVFVDAAAGGSTDLPGDLSDYGIWWVAGRRDVADTGFAGLYFGSGTTERGRLYVVDSWTGTTKADYEVFTQATVNFKALDGSVSAPVYSFASEPDCGMYRIGTNYIGIATGGALLLGMDSTKVEVRGATESNLWFYEGDAALDEKRWRIVGSGGDLYIQTLTDAGAAIGNLFRANRNGTTINYLYVGAEIHVNDGAQTNPQYTFSNDTNTGLYSFGADQLGVTTGGAMRFYVDSGGIKAIVGSSAAPSYSFQTYTTTGLKAKAGPILSLVVGGGERVDISTTEMTMINGQDIVLGNTSVINHNGTSTRDKIRVWNSSLYSIGMQASREFGGLNADYAMTFQMNNDNDRGFWWGDDQHTLATQGAMSLTTNGKLSVAHSIRVGGGEADTTIPGATYRVECVGSLAATVDVVSNTSDIRLKNVTGHLSDEAALEAVARWSAIRYRPNALSLEIGGSEDRDYVGLIAQEVQDYLPEAVRPAPADPSYLTIQYERTIPAIVAAIRALKNRVEELEAA